MPVLIEHIPQLLMFAGLVWAFIVWIVPAGIAAIAGFLAICGLLPGKSLDAHGEGNIRGVAWKGPVRLGFFVVAVVTLVVFGLRSHDSSSMTSHQQGGPTVYVHSPRQGDRVSPIGGDDAWNIAGDEARENNLRARRR